MIPSPLPSFMSNCLTHEGQLTRRAGGVLAARLRGKGWSIRDAAQYLGVSRQRLYAVFDDPGRARIWECAIAGMPVCSAQIAQELKAARQKKPKSPPRPKIDTLEFEVGDVVMTTKYAGIAEEGEEGTIAGLRGSKAALEILVRMPEGEDWFPKADFYDYFATTGLNHNR